MEVFVGTTREDVWQSIHELSKVQKEGSQEFNAKFKELLEAQKEAEEARKKGNQEFNAKFKEVEEAQKEAEEARKKGNQEVNAKFKELADTHKRSKEEFDQGIKEQKELNKEIQKSLNRFIGESGHQWGKFIETLASTGTIQLLKKYGIEVEYVVRHLKDESPNRRYEIDVLAINGTEMVAIEAKKHLTKKDVAIAKERFQVFKKYNKDAQRKTLYGAMAYLDCDEKINLYARQQGFFVFQVTGNSAVIENDIQFKPTHIEPIIQ